MSAEARGDVFGRASFGDQAQFRKTVAKRLLDRARRAIAVGPSVGIAPVMNLDSNTTDLQLSFGVQLLRFDNPLPPKRIVSMLKAKALSEYTRRLGAAIAGGEQPGPAVRKRIVNEVREAIKDELLLKLRPRRIEKPSFAVRAEVDHLLDAGAWNLRVMVGLGVGPAFLSIGPGIEINDGAALVIPTEVSVPVQLSKKVRSPVLDVFLRGELVATDRDAREDRVLLGARLVFDLI